MIGFIVDLQLETVLGITDCGVVCDLPCEGELSGLVVLEEPFEVGDERRLRRLGVEVVGWHDGLVSQLDADSDELDVPPEVCNADVPLDGFA